MSESTIQDMIEAEFEIVKELSPADCISGYDSLLVIFNEAIQFEEIKSKITSVCHHRKNRLTKRVLYKIPFCYENEFSSDLEIVSDKLNLKPEEIIHLYCHKIYTVYFFGFLPGFCYLGSLDEKLHLPRKATPTRQVRAGSVAMTGAQTGIYPRDSPGGWHVIGNTPVLLFQPERNPPCTFERGDAVQFYPLSRSEFEDIKVQVKRGQYQIQKAQLHD